METGPREGIDMSADSLSQVMQHDCTHNLHEDQSVTAALLQNVEKVVN